MTRTLRRFKQATWVPSNNVRLAAVAFVAVLAINLVAALFVSSTIDKRVYRAQAGVGVRVVVPRGIYLNTSQQTFPATQLAALGVATCGAAAVQQLSEVESGPSAPRRVVIAQGYQVLSVAQGPDSATARNEAVALAECMIGLQHRLGDVSILPRPTNIQLFLASSATQGRQVFPAGRDLVRSAGLAAVAGLLLVLAFAPNLPWQRRDGARARGRLASCPGWLKAVLIVATAAACVGPALARPTLSGLFVCVLGFITLIDAPGWIWAALAVVVALLEREVSAAGLGPSAANFLDYPVVLAAVLVAFWRRRPRVPAWSRWLVAITIACVVVSAVASHAGVLRTALTVLVLGEPWLLGLAVAVDPPSGDRLRRRLLAGVVAAGAVEGVFAIFQALSAGSFGDAATGTLVGNQTASHLVGGIGVGAAAVAAFLGVTGTSPRSRWSWWGAGVLLVAMPVVTDAKQVYMMAPVALVAGLRVPRLRGVTRRFRPTPVVTAAVVLAVLVIGATRLISWYNSHEGSDAFLRVFFSGRSGKVVSAKIIADEMSARPIAWTVGLGPGETVSRVALLSKGGIVRADSAISHLHLTASPITKKILAKTLNLDLQKSSLLSGWSSDLGIWGDFGIMGALLYLVGCGAVVRRSRAGPAAPLVRSVVVLSLLLGFIDSWLEQPPFILVVAFIVSVAATQDGRYGPGARSGPAKRSSTHDVAASSVG